MSVVGIKTPSRKQGPRLLVNAVCAVGMAYGLAIGSSLVVQPGVQVG